jgi:hypothetical protein
MKVQGKRSSLHIAYDIAWEFTSLGESSIAYSYLVDACHIGSRIFTLRSSAHTSESQPVLTEQLEEINGKQQKIVSQS